MSLVKSFFTVSFFTLLSRVMGFIRDILIAAMLGTGPLTEAFLVAFKLPNFFRRLFAEGAFNAAFVPMFSERLQKDGKAVAIAFAERIAAVLLIALLVFVTVMELAMPWVMYGLAPGFADDPDQFALATYLTRITFPYLLLISLVSLLAGMLNSVGRFAAVAATPIVLNIIMISALLWLSHYTETPAHALAWGVAAAGLAQCIWLYIACAREGIVLKPHGPLRSTELRQFWKRMAPGIVGAGVVQINLWIDVIIGTFIPSAIAYLYYADRLNQLPLSIIGTAMGTALLPTLSKHASNGDRKAAMRSQNRALETVLFLSIPAMLGLVAIAEPMIRVLFERGAFDAAATQATAFGLMAYAVGLPAFVMVKVFSTAFFAAGDTKTPVITASICVVVNIVLNISLIFLFQHLGLMPHIGLALATSFSSWLNVMLLSVTLIRRDLFHLDARIIRNGVRTFAAGVIMVAALLYANHLLEVSLIGTQEERIGALVLLVGVGMVSFFIPAFLFRAMDVQELKRLLGRKRA